MKKVAFYTLLAVLLLAGCTGKKERVDLSLVPVSLNGTFRYLSVPGGDLLGGEYMQASFFRDGLALVQEGGEWKMIDKDFSTVQAQIPEYPAATPSAKPRPAKDPSRGLYGYKGMAGKWAIAPVFKYASPFYNSYAVVRSSVKFSTRCGLIRKSGDYAIPPIYDEMYRIGPKTYIVRLGGECGIVFADGTPLIPLDREYRFTVPEDDERLFEAAAVEMNKAPEE